jgi:hypothetical protein
MTRMLSIPLAARQLVKALRRAFSPVGYPPKLPYYQVAVPDRVTAAVVLRSLEGPLSTLLNAGTAEEFLLSKNPPLANVALHLANLNRLTRP